jgi:hypothetical protein
MKTTEIIEQMLTGEAVLLSTDTLAEIEQLNHPIRTAHNADPADGAHPWVGWMSGRDSTRPPDFHIDQQPPYHATARPGRCIWSRSHAPLSANYRADVN